MTVQADKQGRNLVLTVEGVDDPWVIRPLAGHAGRQITATYLAFLQGKADMAAFTAAMRMAVDGAVFDKEQDRWVPLPEADQENWRRIDMELSQAEANDVVTPAFMWQTVLGLDGVKAYIEGNADGGDGLGKAVALLHARMARLLLPTSLSSA